MIRTAAPPKGRLVEALTQEGDARFRTARTAGFLFSAGGEINTADPWIADMLARQGRRVDQRVVSKSKAAGVAV